MFGHRIKASVLAGIVVLSTIASLFLPPQKAYAAGTMLDTARGWSVLKATIDYSTNLKANPTKAEVDTCRIFRDSHAIGHHVSISDGMWNISTPPADTISSGLNAVGIAGCSDLMTTLGYTLNGDTYNRGGDRGVNDGLDRNDVVAKLKAKGVEANLAGSDINSDTPSNTIAYVILYQILSKTCGWEYRNAYVDGGGANDEEKTRNAEAKKNGYYSGSTQSGNHSHTYTVEDKKPGDNTYYVNGSGNNNDIYLGPGTSGINMGTDTQLDCADDNEDTVSGRLATRHQYADAYAGYIKQHPDIQDGFNTAASDSANAAAAEGTTTCGIKTAIGWILCPVTSFLAVMLDKMYEFISSKFLVVPSALFDINNGTYKSWKIFRDYANVAFIIAFLIIVYSQVTSIGISNYGIKKLLPKLIIAAVLVNISYYICQGLVELSNLLGYGIKAMFDGVSTAISSAPGGGNSDSGEGGKIFTVIAGALAGTAVVVIAVALGLIIPAIVAVGITFIILLIRQALIVILIVLSPLAFVAWLLPNTENLFKKWWGMLINTLMIFPIIAFLYGGSRLASAVILETSSNGDYITPVIAAGVATVPLVLTWPLLNKAIKELPVFGKKMQNMGDRATGKIGKKANAKSREKWQNSSYMQGKKLRDAGKQQYKRNKFARRVSGEDSGVLAWGTRKMAQGVGALPGANRVMNATGINKLTGAAQAGQQSLAQSAQALADEGFEKDVKAAGLGYATMSSGDVKNQLLDSSGNLNQSLSAAQRAAAIDRVMSSGSFGERRQIVEATSQMSEGEKARVSKGVYAKGDQNIYGSGIGATIQGSGIAGASALRQQTLKNIEEGHVNAEHLVQGEGSAQYMVDVANGEQTGKDASGNRTTTTVGTSSSLALSQLKQARDRARTNTGTSAKAYGGAMADELNRIP